MIFIEGLQKRELPCLRTSGEGRRGIEVQDARLCGTYERALEKGGEPAVRVVLAAEGGQTVRVGEHHVGGEFVRLAAEAVSKPGAEGGTPGGDAPGIHRVESLGVIAHAGGHGAHQRDLIDHLCEVWQQLAELHAALAVLFELPR